MTIFILDKTLQIDISYECDDLDLEDNICVSIIERCPPQEKIFRSGTTHLFLTASQAQQLGEALLESAQQSRAAAAHSDT
jgi:hypothetical protein